MCAVLDLDLINLTQVLVLLLETVLKNMKRPLRDSQQGNVPTASSRTSATLEFITVLWPRIWRYLVETAPNPTLKVTSSYFYIIRKLAYLGFDYGEAHALNVTSCIINKVHFY